MKKKKVNCIIPAYNVSCYLRDAINSVVNQTIGFDKINLIIVNDGSTDDTESIVKGFQKFYPEITYISKENGGVSSARNVGLRFCKEHFNAPFTCFLDGDDKYSLNQMEVLVRFLEKNERKGKHGPDVAFVPIKLFDRETGDHYAYKVIDRGSTRIIDLRKENVFFHHVHNAMFRSNAVINESFDETLEISEDAQFLLNIFRKSNLVGWCNEQGGHLYLRKRADESSTIDNSASNPKFYERISVYRNNFEEYMNELGYIPRFAQNIILYDIHWFRLAKFDPRQYGINIDIDQMRADITYLVSHMDKEVLEQSYIPYWCRALFKKMKYGDVYLRKRTNEVGARFYFGKEPFETLSGHINIRFVNQIGTRLMIRGYFVKPCVDKVQLVCSNMERYTYATLKSSSMYGVNYFLGEETFPTTAFEFDIDISNLEYGFEDVLAFYFKHDDVMEPAIMVHSWFSRFYHGNTFFIGDKAIVKRGLMRHLLEIEKISLTSVSRQILNKMDEYKDHYLLRKYVELFETYRNKRIWLFIDRHNRIDDNAEALFRYCCNIDDGIEKFMVIPDGNYYENFKGLNPNIVIYGSFEYKFLLMFAEKYISSTTFYDSNTNTNISKEEFRKISNSLSNFEEIFLQHGVIQCTGIFDNYLNSTRRDLAMFCATSLKEYTNIIKHSGFTEKQVKLTGLPRFDLLKSNPEKVITLVFTWRTALGDVETRAYNSQFRESMYCKMFNNFINDVRLLEALRVYGYRFVIKLHPELYVQKKDFQIPKEMEIADNEVSYRKLYEISSLMITDYSSAVFDFAYLKKPIIYYQEANTPTPYGDNNDMDYAFDYEKEGFGSVIDNQNDCVDKIIDYLKNGCVMEAMYEERVDMCFANRDTKNSERVYQELIKLS